MTPQENIDLAVECGAGVGPNYAPYIDFPSREKFQAYTARIAEKAIAEHTQSQSAPVLPVPAIKVDAFGEILPTDGRRFVMGDFYTAAQMRGYAVAAIGEHMAPINAELPRLLSAANRVQQLEKELAAIAAAGGAK